MGVGILVEGPVTWTLHLEKAESSALVVVKCAMFIGTLGDTIKGVLHGTLLV